ncbi:MAG: GDSL-like Lipase/Acylhydrolase [Candidatus Hydrogenedentes bacterium]|nr:GDSL-like Lipase/Acylhydrolase [Candidatus Hydrogenedentota bacterium]
MRQRNRWMEKALAFSLCLAFMAIPVFAASTVEPANKMGEEWWAKRHNAIVERVKQGNVDLILLGDSINHGWDTPGKEVFDKYYGHRNAVNMGFSGDRTEHVLWRLDNGEVDGISPKAVSVMIGTNNSKDNTAEEIGAGIVAVVNKLREKLPNTKVLILAIFPREEKPGETRDKLAKASEIASKIADGNMIHYLDIGKVFLTEDGTLPKDIMPDALHPNPHGYALWAAAVEPKIAELMGEVVPPEGFRALFNGIDLRGWKGLVESPKVRAEMAPEKLVEEQAKADERMRAHWKVEDGALVFDGGGDSLCTDRDYADFEMLVDWKILEKGDSGIYLRGSPQVQIWDPAGNPVGSGGLYNNQINPSNPDKCADKPVKEWNSFRIKMVGDKVTVHLNGELVVDNVTMENYWERDKPIYPTGQIELQNHGNTLWFKNVFIREL